MAIFLSVVEFRQGLLPPTRAELKIDWGVNGRRPARQIVLKGHEIPKTPGGEVQPT